MDNNKPATPTEPITPVSTTNAAPIEPIVPQVSVQNAPTGVGGDSKKMVLWLVIGLIIVIGLVGGIYFFLSQQQEANTAQQAVEQPVVKATPKPPADTIDALDRDLNAINVASPEADFIPVDQDLQQL